MQALKAHKESSEEGWITTARDPNFKRILHQRVMRYFDGKLAIAILPDCTEPQLGSVPRPQLHIIPALTFFTARTCVLTHAVACGILGCVRMFAGSVTCVPVWYQDRRWQP